MPLHLSNLLRVLTLLAHARKVDRAKVAYHVLDGEQAGIFEDMAEIWLRLPMSKLDRLFGEIDARVQVRDWEHMWS